MPAPRILLADDHPQILSNLYRLADQAGEVVNAAPDGGAAVKDALRLHPDVVVLDIMMLAVGGLEAVGSELACDPLSIARVRR